MKKHTKRKAFTLTELLVVVVVIGVLAAVVLPKFNKVMETRKTTEAEEIMAAVRTEQEYRCALDKPYLGPGDSAKLSNVLPQTPTKNFNYALQETGMLASSRGKYAYDLKMPSYTDGRICCDGEECNKLNKDYPSCTALTQQPDFLVTTQCTAVIEGAPEPPAPSGCAGAAVTQRDCDTGCGKQTRSAQCVDGAWVYGEWGPTCIEQTTETRDCTSGVGKETRTQTCNQSTGQWEWSEWEGECAQQKCKNWFESSDEAWTYCAAKGMAGFYDNTSLANKMTSSKEDCCNTCAEVKEDDRFVWDAEAEDCKFIGWILGNAEKSLRQYKIYHEGEDPIYATTDDTTGKELPFGGIGTIDTVWADSAGGDLEKKCSLSFLQDKYGKLPDCNAEEDICKACGTADTCNVQCVDGDMNSDKGWSSYLPPITAKGSKIAGDGMGEGISIGFTNIPEGSLYSGDGSQLLNADDIFSMASFDGCQQPHSLREDCELKGCSAEGDENQANIDCTVQGLSSLWKPFSEVTITCSTISCMNGLPDGGSGSEEDDHPVADHCFITPPGGNIHWKEAAVSISPRIDSRLFHLKRCVKDN